MKNKKLYIGVLVAVLLVVIILFALKNTFIFSKDGWNPSERQINSTNIIAKGGGNEPGWGVTVRGEQFNETAFGVDVTLDYGETQWVGALGKTWQKDYSNDFQFRGDIKLLNKDGSFSQMTKNVIFYFEKKSCVDDNDKKYDWVVSLNLNSERDLNGCAEVSFSN